VISQRRLQQAIARPVRRRRTLSDYAGDEERSESLDEPDTGASDVLTPPHLTGHTRHPTLASLF